MTVSPDVQYDKERQGGKTTTVRRTAVRETGVSRGLVDGPLKPPHHYGIGGFEGAFSWASIMPGNTCLSDSRWEFFSIWTASSLNNGRNYLYLFGAIYLLGAVYLFVFCLFINKM